MRQQQNGCIACSPTQKLTQQYMLGFFTITGVEPEPFELGEHLVEASAKLVLIDRLLKWLQANDHKVLLFSQMTHMLDVVQDYLGYRGDRGGGRDGLYSFFGF